MLIQLADVERPRLVVDLGSGTGLSSCVWADRAEEVIGIEPNREMRDRAAARVEALGLTNVRHRDGLGSETGLPKSCADIVTCSQALHWMDPGPTFAEVARILRDGGVFAAYDCDWPPLVHVEVQRAFEALLAKVEEKEKEQDLSPDKWPKEGHLARMKECGHFRSVFEVVAHHLEEGDAERLMGIALSQGGVQSLLKRGLTEEEIGLTNLRMAAERVMKGRALPWYWGYRLRIGVK